MEWGPSLMHSPKKNCINILQSLGVVYFISFDHPKLLCQTITFGYVIWNLKLLYWSRLIRKTKIFSQCHKNLRYIASTTTISLFYIWSPRQPYIDTNLIHTIVKIFMLPTHQMVLEKWSKNRKLLENQRVTTLNSFTVRFKVATLFDSNLIVIIESDKTTTLWRLHTFRN